MNASFVLSVSDAANFPVITGNVSVGPDGKPFPKFNTLVLTSQSGENGVLLARPENSTEETRFVLIAGEPLEQTVVQYGPFVVNTQMEARQAIMDFQMGKNGFERAPGWRSEIGKAMR
jgi:redox-sensitive bicupin YhaK (pirin superfamily)